MKNDFGAMSPQSHKSNLSEKTMESNGYLADGIMTKEARNHSSPCESVDCMCA